MSERQLTVVYRPVGELSPHPNNPREHPATQLAQIAESMREFGWTNPILVDENSVILAGHGRFSVAKDLGLDTVPTVTVAGLTDEQKRVYVLADNKIADNAHWNPEATLAEIEFLTGAGFDHELAGFNDEDLIGLHSFVDDVDFPAAPVERGITITSETEPTVLQGDGVPSLSDQTLDNGPEPGGNFESDVPFDTAPGKVFLNISMAPFQRDRIMEVLEMVKRDEEVTSDVDALFLLAELYAEANGDDEPQEAPPKHPEVPQGQDQ